MASRPGYTRLQIGLHWLAALLIVQQYLFKDAMSAAWEAIGKGVQTAFDPLVLAHVAGGAVVLVFALWRLAIRTRRGAPAVPGDSPVQRALARGTHLGLYALMVLMPVSGAIAWLAASGRRRRRTTSSRWCFWRLWHCMSSARFITSSC